MMMVMLVIRFDSTTPAAADFDFSSGGGCHTWVREGGREREFAG